MRAITIPKEITKKGELIIIPRKEYEELLSLNKDDFKRPSLVLDKRMAEKRKRGR